MFEEKTVLAVVPARGGSKGIPLKNLKMIAGKPLVAWTAELLSQIDWFDQAVVSTDHEEIAEVCSTHGLPAPFRRPDHLAGDRISDLQVLTHALETMEQLDKRTYEIIVLLHPTTPLREAHHVKTLIENLVSGGYDSVWGVSRADLKYHPLKALTLQDGLLGYFDPRGREIIARQQLEPAYYRNGSGYAFTRECLLEQKSIMGQKTSAVVTEDPMVSIDTLDDFKIAEEVLRHRHNS